MRRLTGYSTAAAVSLTLLAATTEPAQAASPQAATTRAATTQTIAMQTETTQMMATQTETTQMMATQTETTQMMATQTVTTQMMATQTVTTQAPATQAAATQAATGAVAAAATKADRTFAAAMRSDYNTDGYLYTGASPKKLRKLGKAVCGVIKVYDRSESAKNALIDTLLDIQAGSDYPYTDDGDSFLLVASIYSYCPKYKKPLAAL